MLHQDLRPDNIMIDSTGTVKIIDFGSTSVAGVLETASPLEQNSLLGTALFAAPEYFVGEHGTSRSDIFSLGVIAYQMLTGNLPYGLQISKIRTTPELRKLEYTSARNYDPHIPAWVDEAIKKALHPNPLNRYEEVSEFAFDLQHPNKAFLSKTRPPLIERHPVVFWKTVSFVLALIIVVILGMNAAVI